MPFNTSPTGIFPGATLSSTGITIPFADLESYKVSTSGDVRELIYSFLEKVSDVVNALPATGVGNSKPTKVSVLKSTNVLNEDTLRKTFSIGIDLNIQSLDVVDEAWVWLSTQSMK